MSRPISIALAVIGIVLLVYGLKASDSTASHLSKTFTGNPTDKSMWLIIGGIAGILIGGGTLLFRGPRN
jgi:uncharacterized membrane protein